mmetsp:Transcript_18361/g.39743  ORF Transcript_18361/g.39743 Transcript_18361/m.39743 type:complete len:258 (-) Transcript_18361:116-889(-)
MIRSGWVEVLFASLLIVQADAFVTAGSASGRRQQLVHVRLASLPSLLSLLTSDTSRDIIDDDDQVSSYPDPLQPVDTVLVPQPSDAMRRMVILAAISTYLLPTPQPANAMYENAPVRPDTGPTKLPSGVSYEDLRPGTGDTVAEGKRVNIQWVLKRSNGYFVDSSERNDGIPFIFTVGDPKGAIAGLDEGIRGMRAGGIRRIVIPPELAYVDGVEDGKPGPVPEGFGPKQRIRRVMILLKDIPGESILLDVKATRVQ